MAHGRLRKETNCLNCNARVFGPYCHVCGQPNTEPRETVWGLIIHFFNDITHFEGKFITSLRLLLFKPGRLTLEYIRGRRASYMNPVRMYIFTSAFFFLIFFLMFDEKNVLKGEDDGNVSPADLAATKKILEKARTKDDTVFIRNMFGPVADSVLAEIEKAKKDSADTDAISQFKTVAAYDSAQAALPPGERDSWLERQAKRRSVQIGEKYDHDYNRFFREAIVKFIHSFPKILFVSLPVFAMLLGLLYSRHNQWYYVDHLIFSIHFFIFAFLWILLFMAVGQAGNYLPFLSSSLVRTLWFLYSFVYLYKSMRYVYSQRRAKTIVKFLILLFSMLFVSMIIFTLFFSFTVLTI